MTFRPLAPLLALAIALPAAGAPAPTPAQAPTPTTAAAPAEAPAAEGVSAASTGGLRVSADLRDEYVAGFPMLVEVVVRNEGDAPKTFPDLSARPHLVHFLFQRENRRTDRYNTPPAVDPGTTWTISPRGSRRVLLEIPASAGLDPGVSTLTVRVDDPAGPVTLPSRDVRLATAKPVGGQAVHEPTIAATLGAMVPWVHQAASGFDLYLLHLDPKAPTRAQGQYHLLHLDRAVDPILSRARASDALSRYIYWQSGTAAFTFARMDGYGLRGKPRTVSLPWPAAEPLGRGATDSKGGVAVPLWVPAPKGGGGVRVLTVDDRGGFVLRDVADFPAKPAAVASAVDAAGNLALALGHAGGVDLYRVDATLPAELPARGVRVVKAQDGWMPAGLTFETLPDRGDRPGGLSLFAVLRRKGAEGESYRTLWAELGGKVVEETPPQPWTAPGELESLLVEATGPFYYLSRDAAGALWYGAQGGTPVRLDGAAAGTLWSTADTVQLRRVVPGRVVEDRVLGPKQP